MNVPNVPAYVLDHRKQVLKLYKEALRHIAGLYVVAGRSRVRIESVILRQRFEDNRNCKGEEAINKLVEGKNELKANLSYSPLKFAGTYGGLLTDREMTPPDYVLDYWHPLEKMQYPVYFARREERKKEFIEMWNKLYKSKKRSL